MRRHHGAMAPHRRVHYNLAGRWLRRMLKDGEVELTTESERSPGAKYRLRLRGPN